MRSSSSREFSPISLHTLYRVSCIKKEFQIQVVPRSSFFLGLWASKRLFFTCSNDCFDSRVKNEDIQVQRETLSLRGAIQPLKVSPIRLPSQQPRYTGKTRVPIICPCHWKETTYLHYQLSIFRGIPLSLFSLSVTRTFDDTLCLPTSNHLEQYSQSYPSTM